VCYISRGLFGQVGHGDDDIVTRNAVGDLCAGLPGSERHWEGSYCSDCVKCCTSADCSC
jgi:hypothetical protein